MKNWTTKELLESIIEFKFMVPDVREWNEKILMY